jgi:hypothetical protein
VWRERPYRRIRSPGSNICAGTVNSNADAKATDSYPNTKTPDKYTHANQYSFTDDDASGNYDAPARHCD